ncbi:MAG: threonine aldolase [Spirochaetes bacterium DG_61]|jgi:threonine aldolase|nr:MAG: threonine aldolase [Spirochaetes bacterium DG_61]
MIDLSSDTATKPTPAMRSVMAEAEVGDEQRREDPTVNRLLQMVCELLHKEAALFLPSGTMCNGIAVKVHTQPGEAILVDRHAHILRSESGGAAFLSGVIVDQLPSTRGLFTAEDVIHSIQPESVYTAPHRLLCVEQTHNFGGGSVWPLEQLRDVCSSARSHGLAIHMDGARLFNAVVASGVAPHRYAKLCESVWIDFTKGLGAPLGAVLAGSASFIEKARRYKHLFGGALRQAGIVAAGCIYALKNHVERLKEDHEHARILGEGLDRIPGVLVERPIETNMVFFRLKDTSIDEAHFLSAIQTNGIRMGMSGKRIRAVTHLDIRREDVNQAIEVCRRALEET